MPSRFHLTSPRFIPLYSLIVALSLALTTTAFGADAETPAPGTILAALSQGSMSLGLRYRTEAVWDDDSRYSGRKGAASTLRTSLAYRTASYRGVSGFLEFENVADIGLGGKHNNLGGEGLSNGVTNRPAIADPELSEVNQVYLRLDFIPGTVVDLGRREMALADQRFLGPVAWRQNHQSFDGIHLTQRSIPNALATYAYLHNVNRIFGDNHPLAGHILDVAVRLTDRVTLAPYVLYLDYERPANAALSTTTVGARGSVSWTAGGWKIPVEAGAAWQRDAADNPNRYDTRYYRISVAAGHARHSLGVGFEVLGGQSDEGAFATPLATLHKFNGWADKFLATPPDGLRDLSVTARSGTGSLSGILTLHAFTADSGGATYGQEVDTELSYRTEWNQVVAAKLALYYSDSFAEDTQKLWVYSSYGF